jgi:hypothetical protein
MRRGRSVPLRFPGDPTSLDAPQTHMTREELFPMIQGAGMIPVPVSREGDAEEVLNYFEGELKGFLVAAKAIGSTAVFVMESPLDEDHFYYRYDDDPGAEEEEDDDERVVEEIDLSTVLPSLSAYKRRLGETYSFFLMAKGGADNLCLFHYPEWVDDFEDEIEQAEGLAVLSRHRKKKD